jgi:hypothetical protein
MRRRDFITLLGGCVANRRARSRANAAAGHCDHSEGPLHLHRLSLSQGISPFSSQPPGTPWVRTKTE